MKSEIVLNKFRRQLLPLLASTIALTLGFAQVTMALPNCPSGQYRDAQGNCVYNKKTCSDGFSYDPATGSCVSNCSAAGGLVWDSASQQCVSTQNSCNSSQYWDSATKKCVNIVTTRTCTAPYVLDTATNTCKLDYGADPHPAKPHVPTTRTEKIYANPNLNNCLIAPPFTVSPTTPKRPDQHFDCVPTPQDVAGNPSNPADLDYKQWKDQLFAGKDQSKPITGFYTKNRVRCDVQAPSVQCPIAVKAKFVISCNTDDPVNYSATLKKCAIAQSIRAYHAVYQAVNIPGEMPIKAQIVGGAGASLTPATPVNINSITNYNNAGTGSYDCSKIVPNGIQQGEDSYGIPICVTDPKAQEIAEIKAQLNAQMCDVEKKQVNETGGTTTKCSPNITVIKLYGLKPIADCTANGGGLVDLSGNSVSVANVNHNQRLFCKISGASCPNNFLPYKSNNTSWTATSANSATGYCSSNMFCKSCSGTTCSTGSHAWGNRNQEGACAAENKTRNGSCGVDFVSYVYSAPATITSIGCY